MVDDRSSHCAHDADDSAHTPLRQHRTSVLAGYQMHMSKPVEPAELIAMVASLAGRTGRAV
jgi:hypothetical protein